MQNVIIFHKKTHLIITMLNEKLNFISYIYELIPHKYVDNKSLFVYKKEGKWSYGPSFEELKEIASADDLIEDLLKNNYDLDRLELYADDIILNQCIVMQRSLKKAMKFVTEEQIQLKEAAWLKMFESMKQMIENDLFAEPKQESHLKLVD
jgi:hypothetical protein